MLPPVYLLEAITVLCTLLRSPWLTMRHAYNNMAAVVHPTLPTRDTQQPGCNIGLSSPTRMLREAAKHHLRVVLLTPAKHQSGRGFVLCDIQ